MMNSRRYGDAGTMGGKSPWSEFWENSKKKLPALEEEGS